MNQLEASKIFWRQTGREDAIRALYEVLRHKTTPELVDAIIEDVLEELREVDLRG